MTSGRHDIIITYHAKVNSVLFVRNIRSKFQILPCYASIVLRGTQLIVFMLKENTFEWKQDLDHGVVGVQKQHNAAPSSAMLQWKKTTDENWCDERMRSKDGATLGMKLSPFASEARIIPLDREDLTATPT